MMFYWKTIPPLKALLAVEAVARLRSFTRAGEELNTSQSAVSHAVSQAEAFLETVLFIRSARPIALTPEGSRYVATLSACLAQLSTETEMLRHPKQDNILTISCNLAYGNYWLLPLLKIFHEAHPEIQVNMVTAFHGLASLYPGVDVAIRFGGGSWPNCESKLLFHEQILPVAAPAYRDRTEKISNPADLLDHTLLHALAPDKTWYDWQQWFHHFNLSCPAKLPGPSFDNHLTMMQAALSGRGVALGWIGTATEFLREGLLVPLLNTPVVLENGLYAVTRQTHDPRVDVFVDWICEHTKSQFNARAARFWSEPIS